MDTQVSLTIDLSEDEAMALAQLAKRFSWETAGALANRYDEGRERDLMIDAVCTLQRALGSAGFSPR